MKKHLLLVCFAQALFLSPAWAQPLPGPPPIPDALLPSKFSVSVAPLINLGGSVTLSFDQESKSTDLSSAPGVVVMADYVVARRLSIGGMFLYRKILVEAPMGQTADNDSSFSIAARGMYTFHKQNQLALAAFVHLGAGKFIFEKETASSVSMGVYYGVGVHARYKITPTIGVFTELSYNVLENTLGQEEPVRMSFEGAQIAAGLRYAL